MSFSAVSSFLSLSRSLLFETIGGKSAETGEPRGRSRVFLQRYVFVYSCRLLGYSEELLLPSVRSPVTFRSDLSFSLAYSFQQQSDDDQREQLGESLAVSLPSLSPVDVCVSRERVLTTTTAMTTATMTTLNRSFSPASCRSTTPVARARHTQTHTHTRTQRGETMGRAVRGLLYACVLGVQKERERASEVYSVKRAGGVSSRR